MNRCHQRHFSQHQLGLPAPAAYLTVRIGRKQSNRQVISTGGDYGSIPQGEALGPLELGSQGQFLGEATLELSF